MGSHDIFSSGTIVCSGRREVDTAALGVLGSGAVPQLFPCRLTEENGRHRFTYDLNGAPAISQLQGRPAFEDALEVLDCAAAMLAGVRENGLAIENIKVSKDYIFRDGDGYRFVYIPLAGKQNVSVRDCVIKLLSVLHVKDARLSSFAKELRRRREDGQAMKLLAEFLTSFGMSSGRVRHAGGEYSRPDPEEEATSLLGGADTAEEDFDGEGLTTFLTPDGDGDSPQLPDDDAEGETTFLSTPDDDGEEPELTADDPVFDTDLDGSTEFFPDVISEDETTVLTHTPDIPLPVKPSPAGPRETLSLVRRSTGEVIPVDVTPFTIGKDRANMDCVIDSDSVSRHHATVTYEDGSYYITDNNSTNGTVIEGIRLQPYERAELGDGYFISLGRESFQARLGRR